MYGCEDVEETVRKSGSRVAVLTVVLSAVLWATPPFAQRQTTAASEVNLTATSANVGESGIPVKIRILRWSTDEERRPVVAALTPGAPVPAPSASASPADAAAGAPAAGERGAAGRGGRGGGRGGRGDAAAPPTPIAVLTTAIEKAPTVGYIWTNDVTGYSIKYAYHGALPGGGERIILATDRRLGAYTTAWKPLTAAPAGDYEFTVIELRLDTKGMGEGRTSLTTKVIVDGEAKTLALDNYAATPATLRNVKR